MTHLQTEAPPPSLFRRVLRIAGNLVLGVAVVLLGAWSIFAIYYSNLPGATLRGIAAAAFGIGWLAAFALLRRRRRTALWFLASFVAIAAWHASIAPSHDRDWAPEYARMPRATFEGDRVTVHDVRDFDYTGAEEFTAGYYDRTYDLNALESTDLFFSYWDGNRSIAHTILSFGFTNGDYLAVSVETRRERGEQYSTIGGFFKQYELTFVLADERDIVRLRTNHRGEDVYLYPMRIERDEARAFLTGLLERANSLYREPEFYNALVDNCTTSLIAVSAQVRNVPIEFDIRMLLNGRLDELIYQREGIVGDESHGLPFAEMRGKHRITEQAQPFDLDPQFSAKIRAQLPKRTK